MSLEHLPDQNDDVSLEQNDLADQNDDVSLEQNDLAECPICLSRSGEYVQLHCGHSFHRTCVREWKDFLMSRGKSPTCPLCRVPFMMLYPLKLDDIPTKFGVKALLIAIGITAAAFGGCERAAYVATLLLSAWRF